MAKKDFETLWDDVRVWLTDATRTAIKEAEDLTRHGRLKMDILRISRDIEKALADLGGRAYKHLSKQPDSPFTPDEDGKRLLHRIAKLETELASLRREYEEKEGK
jgi:hypothetical protein